MTDEKKVLVCRYPKNKISLMFIILFGLFFLGIFSKCEEPIAYEFNLEQLPVIVVNGLLTNENKEHEIAIYQPVNAPGEIPIAVSNALVYLNNGDTTLKLDEDAVNKGRYKTPIRFRAVINKAYTLLIRSGQKNYFATAFMLPVSRFRRAKFGYNEENQMFTIDSVTRTFDIDEAAMYEIQIDWTKVTGYETIADEAKKAKLYYYTLKTIDISEIFSPEKEKIYFPAGTTIIESKYSLTNHHADYIRSILLETEWRGGLFDVQQGNAKTNLNGGAFGFFGVSTVIRDTFVVN